MDMMRLLSLMVLVLSLVMMGCDDQPQPQAGDGAAGAGAVAKVRIALNWVPEPEFGGIYAAKERGDFARENLEVEILPGGAGAPTWQMVGAGQVDFGIASADEVAIARARGADIVALFTTYQTCPQGIMVHQDRGLTSIDQVFQGGTLAIEKGLAYASYLEKKYGFDKVKLVPYDGGIATFLADKQYAQQCFIFSEPIAARRQGASPQVFLVADAGYNPYTAVLIARGDYVRANPERVEGVIRALRAGWQAYLEDPEPANKVMGQLNRTMDAQTFTEAAKAQEPLVLPEGMPAEKIGTMTLDRWQELIKQLRELGVLDKDVDPAACFRPTNW
jgi:NitT/TauT family transport system substrate-binding protein